MTLEEAKRIIKEERLEHFCIWYDEDRTEYAAGIKKEGDKWMVYTTLERASIVEPSIRYRDNLEDALDVFIDLARYKKSNFIRLWEEINHRPYPNK